MYANMYSHALVRALNVKTVNSLSRMPGATLRQLRLLADIAGECEIRGINHGSMGKVNLKWEVCCKGARVGLLVLKQICKCSLDFAPFVRCKQLLAYRKWGRQDSRKHNS